MSDKCFCHLNGLAVKDATARKMIEDLKNSTSSCAIIPQIGNENNVYINLKVGELYGGINLKNVQLASIYITVHFDTGESLSLIDGKLGSDENSFTFKILGIDGYTLSYELRGNSHIYNMSNILDAQPTEITNITCEFNGGLFYLIEDVNLFNNVAQHIKSYYKTIDYCYDNIAILNSAVEQPVSIDLSNFDNGEIIETYESGITKTTTVEFDENGNPIKIIAGDKETALIW